MTFERGGNNANSPLLNGNISFIRAPEPPAPQQLLPQFGSMARRAMLYYIAKATGTWLFPGYLHHRRRTLISETYLWTRSYVRLLSNRRDNELIEELTSESKPPFFLVALQVHDDLLASALQGKGQRQLRVVKRQPVEAIFALFHIGEQRPGQRGMLVEPFEPDSRPDEPVDDVLADESNQSACSRGCLRPGIGVCYRR